MRDRTLSRPLETSLPHRTKDTRISNALALRGSGGLALLITQIGAYFFLWAPILLLVVFSFNDSRSVDAWRGLTFRWYENIFSGVIGSETRFSTDLMLSAVQNSLIVGLSATLISTFLGTMIAISLARGRYPGKRFIEGLLFLPMVIPEITQGVSLAMFFRIVFDFIETTSGTRVLPGFGTIIIGHVVFNISYVAIVVRARMVNMNPRLEEAAQDLGANTWQTFRRVTLPLIMPGIIAGALLAFTLSLDDFVITFFTSGVGTNTLPIFVYGLLKVAVTPEVNAISTLMLIASTVLVGFSLILQSRSSDL